MQELIPRLERTRHSREVWDLIVQLGRAVNLPHVDFISASSYRDWRRTLFIRTSYDSSWLQSINDDLDLQRWSYFRSHAMHCLTPLMTGIEFIDEFSHVPARRVAVLQESARHGMRAGFCIPLRQQVPPQPALISYSGDHSRREMTAIVRAHGWALHAGALMAHQRFLILFSQEFSERNHITEKQSDLLTLIGRGLQDKQIAEELEVSVSAVRQRMQALISNTGLTSRSELAALAMWLGLLPDPLSTGEDNTQTVIEMDNVGERSRRHFFGSDSQI